MMRIEEALECLKRYVGCYDMDLKECKKFTLCKGCPFETSEEDLTAASRIIIHYFDEVMGELHG